MSSIRPVSANTMILTVPAEDEECYHVRIPFAHTLLHVGFNVIDTHLSSDQVRVILTADSGKVLYRSKFGKDHGTFQYKQEPVDGRYQVCVQNAIKGGGGNAPRPRKQILSEDRFDSKPRTVHLMISVSTPTPQEMDEKTKTLLLYANMIVTATTDLTGHFEFRKFRETKHRMIVEKIFVELLWWTLAQAIFVMGLATAQVLYLRRVVNRRIC